MNEIKRVEEIVSNHFFNKKLVCGGGLSFYWSDAHKLIGKDWKEKAKEWEDVSLLLSPLKPCRTTPFPFSSLSFSNVVTRCFESLPALTHSYKQYKHVHHHSPQK